MDRHNKKPQMRLIFTIDKSYPFCEGGSEVHAFKAAQALTKAGMEIKIICPRPKTWRPRRQRINGVAIYELAAPFDVTSRFFFGIYNFQLIIVLILLSRHYDGLQFFGLRGFKVLIRFAEFFHKIYFLKITSQKNWYLIMALLDKAETQKWPAMKYCRGFIVPSRELEDLLLANNIPSDQIAHIVNGTSIPKPDRLKRNQIRRQLSLSQKSTLVMYVGRLHPDKNIDFLLRAWPRVRHIIDSAQLLLLGDGCEKAELQHLIQELKIGDSVTLCGAVCHDAVYDYLFASDVFVLPSRQEGCSNALLEAMSVGLACVATPCSGNQEIICHGENGFLVEYGDIDKLAQTIIKLLVDERMRGKIKAQAIHAVEEKFSIEKTARGYLNFYMSRLKHAP